jgi:signal transduction histidine kinase
MSSDDAVFWIRTTNFLGAYVPFVFALLKYAVCAGCGSVRWSIKYILSWISLSVFTSLIALSHWFIPFGSTPDAPRWGGGYYAYSIIFGVSLLYLFSSAVIEAKRSVGVKRLELQLLILGGSGSAALILALMIMKRLFGDQALISAYNIQPLIAIGFYSVVVYAMTNHRILDAAQLAFFLAGRFLILSTSVAAFVISQLVLERLTEQLLATVLSVSFVLWVSSRVEISLKSRSQADGRLSNAKRVIYDAARQDDGVDVLVSKFSTVLSQWADTDKVIIHYSPKPFDLTIEGRIGADVLRCLIEMKWVTPERLAREKDAAGRHSVKVCLEGGHFGIMAVGEGPSFAIIVALGVGPSRRPYTYPQVVELLELAAIMESALERAHFAAKVQRTEQLATVGLVGASLAHEIRNPLVSIKTFVQLLPTHYGDPAFREKFFRLIGDEVARIDELTQQLLDMAAPRTYQAEPVGLHAVLRPGLELVEARASERGVRVDVVFSADPDVVVTDAAAAKQVLLNLCFNAIQAVEAKGGPEKWVRLTTRRVAEGVELAVADSGPGIAPEMQRRLFQPFQTTRSRGFGLGLAICRDILANVRATIAVDPALPGQGATFRVTFPCPVPSS